MLVFDPGAGAPERWIVCFSRKCATAPWLPIGKYKHVRAFGLVGEINTWVFYDPRIEGLIVTLARGDEAQTLISEFIFDAAVIVMPARQKKSPLPLFGWCAPAIAHLLGIRGSCLGALRPDTLFRQCLRNGGSLTVGYPLPAATPTA